MHKDEFWATIGRGTEIDDEFYCRVSEFEQSKLIDLHQEYIRKASQLPWEEIRSLFPSLTDEELRRLTEWVVSRGQLFYLNVRFYPHRTLPARKLLDNPSVFENTFKDILESVYAMQYGGQIPEATST